MKSLFSILSCFLFSISPSLAQWDSVAGGTNGNVNALCVYKGALYTGGAFTRAGTMGANNIASWNGSKWSNAGLGVTWNGLVVVNSLTDDTVDNSLYVGGEFDSAGSINAYDIASWNGSTWQGLGDGISGYAVGKGVHAIAVYHDSIYTGGSLVLVDGISKDSINNIACWNNTSWGNVQKGVGGNVYAMCTYNSSLYVAGSFVTAGGKPSNQIAEWNDLSWSTLGTGIKGYTVFALTVYNGNLIAAGAFDTAGGSPAGGIAEWNGTSWAPFGKGVPSSGIIYALTTYNGKLVAAGLFDSIGGIAANNIAVWDGISWSALSSGTNNTVNTVAIYNGNLYAGGAFDSAGGKPANNIAVWSGPLAVNEISGNNGGVEVYPNPSNGRFIFELSGLSDKSSVEIYDMLGQRIYSHYSIPNTQYQLNLSTQAAGMYFYKVITEEGKPIANGKLIIQ